MDRPVYRLIDHTADMAYEVEAASFADLLSAATAALADIVLERGEHAAAEEQPIEVAGADREDVLVAWLNEVALRYEDEGFLAWEASVAEAAETSARGILRGATLDPVRDPPDRVIKAVTYHDLAVVVGDGDRPWSARIVLDL